MQGNWKEKQRKQVSDITGWKFYNLAAIPNCSPHEDTDLTPIQTGEIWKIQGKPLFARWTTNYDCEYETEWWYTILDKPCRIETLKSDKRYKINKGLKYYKCVEINPADYAHDMAVVTFSDFQTYPKKYRPNTLLTELENNYKSSTLRTWGAFNEEEKLCAFCTFAVHDKYIELLQNKSIPEEQKNQVNAALIYTAVYEMTPDIESGKYISNGQRNLYHETAFNDYLCKYFGFRRVYCKLHICYKKSVGVIVNILYPFRKILRVFDGIKLIHKVNSVLKMHEIARTFDE